MDGFIYRARLQPEPEGGFSVAFPDVPEAFGAGDDREEALESARQGLAEALLIYVEPTRTCPRRPQRDAAL